MCYSVYISTTAPVELATVPSEHYRLAPLGEYDDSHFTALLRHPNRWMLECKYGGCSCHFRHYSNGLVQEFVAPADFWIKVDAEDVEATAAVYDLLARIVAEGHQVDVLDSWYGDDPEEVQDLTVSLAAVPREAFLFFQGYRFDIEP